MADIGSLVINIRVAADEVDSALAAAQQKIQEFAKTVSSISANSIAITVDDQALQKASAEATKLQKELAAVSAMPVSITVDDQALKSASEAATQMRQSLTDSAAPIAITVNDQMLEQTTGAITKLVQSLEAIATKEIKISVDTSEIEQAAEKVKTVMIDAMSSDALNAATQQGTEMLQSQMEAIAQSTNAVKSLTDEMINSTKAMVNVGEAGVKAIDGITQSTKKASFATEIMKDTLKSLSVSLITGAISWVADQLVELINISKKQEEARQEAIKNSTESAKGYSETAMSIRELADEYEALGSKLRTASEENRFVALQSKIADALGITTDAVASQSDNIDGLITKMELLAQANAKMAADENMKAANTLLASSEYANAARDFANIEGPFVLNAALGSTDAATSDYLAKAGAVQEHGRKLAEYMINSALDGAESEGKVLGYQAREVLTNMLLGMQPDMTKISNRMSKDEIMDAGAATAHLLANTALNVANNPQIISAVDTMNDLHKRVIAGDMTPEEFVAEGQAQSKLLQTALTAAFDKAGIKSDVSKPIIKRLMGSWIDERWLGDSQEVIKVMTEVGKTYASLNGNVQETQKIEDAFEALNGSAAGVTKSYATLKQEYDDVSTQKNAVAEWAKLREEYDNLADSDDAAAKLNELNAVLQIVGLGVATTGDDLAEFDIAMQGIAETADASSETFAEDIAVMVESLTDYREQLEAEDKLGGEFDHAEKINSTSTAIDFLTALLVLYGYSATESVTATGELVSQYTAMSKSLQGIDTTISKSKALAGNIKTAKDAIKEYKNLNKEMQQSPKAIKSVNDALKPFGRSFDGTVESLEEAEDAMESYTQTLQSQITQAEGELYALEVGLASLDASADVDGSFAANGDQMQAEIDAKRAELALLRAEAAAMGIPMGSGSGGGGGGGGKNAEEEAAKEAERLRKEAIQRDYDLIAHKRHMNEITLEQELTMLERIRRAHQLNAEEIMDWEEKIYDLKKEIRERDAGSVDQLGDGIIDALSARYEAMLEAETDRLDASREGWEKWRDDSVKAIEDQIAALDKLADTEDREAKDAEELRKIEKIRRDIEYEQDDYNRMKLQEQLEKALSDREDRLRKLELQDQKDALREEIDKINEKADEQITALDKEQEAIEKSYEERLENAALQAEAERLVMQSNQEELIKLLGDFAPEYDALGKTFGEKLVEGFQDKVGNIVSWFEDFNASLYEIQQNAASAALAGTDAFYAAQSQRTADANAASATPATVNQTVNFYEPVESPSKVARRIEEANEALGAMLV